MTAELQLIVPISGHEIIVRCVKCRTVILVGGHVADIDPDTYRGVFCCQVSHEDWDTGQEEAAA